MTYSDRMMRHGDLPTFKGGPRDGEVVTHSRDLVPALPIKMHWPINQGGTWGSGYVRGPDGNYHWRERMRLS